MVALARLLRLYLNQEERAAGCSAPLRPSGLRGARPGAARRGVAGAGRARAQVSAHNGQRVSLAGHKAAHFLFGKHVRSL